MVTEEGMLINCVAYQEGKRLADIPVADISEYVKRPDCFVWVALKDPTPEELTQMQEEFDLHPLAIEDAMHGHQRPKAEEYGKSLFVVLHVPEMQGEEVHAGELDIFVGPNYVLTARHGFEHGFQQARARAEADPDLLKTGSGFVLYALLDEVVRPLFPAGGLARGPAREARGAHLHRGAGVGQHAPPLRAQAPDDGDAPCGRAADRGDATSSSADGYRRCAWACRSTFATSTTTCCA
jgi:hypothetical protein